MLPLVCLSLIVLSTVAFNNAGKQPNIKLTNMDKCEAEKEGEINWNFEMNNVDSNEYKSLDLDIEFKSEFNDEYTYSLGVDKMNNGDWESDVFVQEGNLCELINQYVQRAWVKLVDTMQPRPESYCLAQPGKYSFKGFEIMKPDVNIPPIYGSLRGTLRVYNEDDENVLCGQVYLDVSEK